MSAIRPLRSVAGLLPLMVFSVWISALRPVVADEPPACGRPTLGQTGCFTARLCECIYDRGGEITGTPAGYRWDCAITRPKCGAAANVPPTTNPYLGPYPSAIAIDRSDNSVRVRER